MVERESSIAQVEWLDGLRFATIREAKEAVLEWLGWYARSRMHSTPDYSSPDKGSPTLSFTQCVFPNGVICSTSEETSIACTIPDRPFGSFDSDLLLLMPEAARAGANCPSQGGSFNSAQRARNSCYARHWSFS